MAIFIQVVLPVLFIFFLGYIVQKWKKVDIKSISTVAIYITTPCLVFKTFYEAVLDRQYIIMVVFSFLLLFFLIFITKLFARLRKYPQCDESALILSTAFMNSGNYGAPIILFAYGELGFAYSISILVLQAIIMNFFGVYYAARGQAGVKIAIRSVLAMPITYAALLALVMQIFQIPFPSNFFSSIDFLSAAAVPIVMLILGMQLAEIKLNNLEWDKIYFGVAARLFISPVIAYLIILFIPMNPLLQKVLIVSAAMPSAATTTIYALQFNSKPDLVASITLITTFLSIFTITLLLVILG